MKAKAAINIMFLVTVVLLTSVTYVIGQPRKVKIESGWIQGGAENGLTIFRGIPFAAPPVGDLRWREPQPVEKWDSVKHTN
jgi:para-nitrobenzyl esterase